MSNTNPKACLDIQLVLQGGGAKIVALLAALEAVQELQSESRLRVVAIAGTSAGAIAACLFGAEIRMDAVRKHLRGLSDHQLKTSFPAPSVFSAASKFLRNRPLWSFQAVKDIVGPLFAEAGVNTLGDLQRKSGVRIAVVAADLGDGRKIAYTGSESQILNALEDSCAIPFCFRIWSKSSQRLIVDGGLCENLPVSEFAENPTAPVIGLSFARSTSEAPTTFLDFSKALFDTAINNSVERARQSVAFDKIIPLDTSIGSFDFDRALKSGLGAEYDLTKTRTKDALDRYLSAKRESSEITPDLWARQNSTTMMQLGDVNKIHDKYAKFHYLHAGLTVQANCMLAHTEEGYGRPDVINYEVTFDPIDDPILFHSIALNSAADFAFTSQNPTIYSVLDGAGDNIPTIAIPSQDREYPTERDLILFFEQPLRKGKGPYKLRFADSIKNLVKDLPEKGEDFLELYPRRAEGKVDRIDLVLIFPKRYNLRMSPAKGQSKGQLMTPKQLNDWRYYAPPGFAVAGWYGADMEGLGSHNSFRVDLQI